MKVSTTRDFTEEERRMVARFLGREGLASHIECSAWSKQQIEISVSRLRGAEVTARRPFPANRVIREGENPNV